MMQNKLYKEVPVADCWCGQLQWTAQYSASGLWFFNSFDCLTGELCCSGCLEQLRVFISESRVPCNVLLNSPLMLNLAYGAVCQPSCESWTLHSDSFDEHSKRIYLVTDSCSAEWRCFSCAVYKFAYLLTYKSHTHTTKRWCTCLHVQRRTFIKKRQKWDQNRGFLDTTKFVVKMSFSKAKNVS